MTLSLDLAGLTGCGSGSSSTQTPPPPSITSLTVNPTSITDGSSATLTGVFANGTGVITPRQPSSRQRRSRNCECHDEHHLYADRYSSGNDSTSLYGWQDFGAYNVFSDGPSDATCPGAGPIGTMSPTARAFQLFRQMAVNGQTVLTATVAGDTTEVRAYAATNPNGTALLLFNDNETTSQQVVVALSSKSSSSSVNVTTYDKAIYDLSGSATGTPPDPSGTSTWAPPITTSMGAQTLPLTLTLAPWSMNMVIFQ